ncbi:MAG: TrmH family RNA methyltransferase [Flavobacteriales bacterium]
MDDRYDLLSSYLTDARMQRFAEVLGQRTNWVTAVTEDLFDPHNISAVLRSCDGFGIQSAHIIEVNNPYRVSPGVAKGAAKWLDIERHTDTTHALRDLKSRGFAICCTTPHTDDTTPEELPLDRPVALVFGSEGPGITDAARAEADHFVRIPMYGFTESFNISVAAALTLQTVTRRVRASNDIDWRIPESDHPRILGDWASRTVKDAPGLLERLRSGEVPPSPHAPSA